jgi:hypothetical protein
VHAELGKLTNLKVLRLEGGGPQQASGLPAALTQLNKYASSILPSLPSTKCFHYYRLERLELLRFHIDATLSDVWQSLSHLKSFFISPDGENVSFPNLVVCTCSLRLSFRCQ